MEQKTDFNNLGLSEPMLAAIRSKGFEHPSPIQNLVIPTFLSQTNDIIAQAQTGTGKTAAFGVPLIEKLERGSHGVKALILVPTRELALQVTEEIISFNYKNLSIAAIYGGASMSEQLRRLKKGIDIVVGTPGRILDHISRRTLLLDGVDYLVLDEADEMLNMGFIDDIEKIMSGMNEAKRVMLFSATMPSRIVSLSKKYMRNTEILKVAAQQLTTELTNQIYFEVREEDKFDALSRIIDIEPEFYGIVFSRTRLGVDQIVSRLMDRGYSTEGLHGDVSQAQREKTLKKFKKKAINILVATDVAARGIDVENLTHVINYSLPQDSESYVHRIGRTGRAGNEGTAITFISRAELRQFGFMRKAIGGDIKRETLPSAQDIIAIKRNKIKEDLDQIVENQSYEEYMDMAQEILDSSAPQVALSALLKLAFKSELSESSYAEVHNFTVDRRGTARLFISIGRLDGYDARKIVELLKRECGMNDSKINDIKVMESYSFVSVPFADAENAIRKLNALSKGDRPMAEIAKEKSESGGDTVGLEGNIGGRGGRGGARGGARARGYEGGDGGRRSGGSGGGRAGARGGQRADGRGASRGGQRADERGASRGGQRADERGTSRGVAGTDGRATVRGGAKGTPSNVGAESKPKTKAGAVDWFGEFEKRFGASNDSVGRGKKQDSKQGKLASKVRRKR